MKTLLATLALALVATPMALAQDEVSLLGTWIGERQRIAMEDDGRRGGLTTLVIDKQEGRTFSGSLTRANPAPTGDQSDGVWGAFTPGGNLIMGSDDEGTYIFDLVDENTLDYCYSEAGATARTTCARLNRQP